VIVRVPQEVQSYSIAFKQFVEPVLLLEEFRLVPGEHLKTRELGMLRLEPFTRRHRCAPANANICQLGKLVKNTEHSLGPFQIGYD
jgi:hypothetical protein